MSIFFFFFPEWSGDPLKIPILEFLPQKLKKRIISLKWHMGCVCFGGGMVCLSLCRKDMINFGFLLLHEKKKEKP